MAYGDHSGALGQTWLGRPEPFDDESFTSWYCRVAASNGLSPECFYRVINPGARLYLVDLDRFVGDDLFHTLFEGTSVGVDRIRNLSLQVYLGRIFADAPARSRLAWVPPAGQNLRSFGQQICPSCIREGAQPYLRQQWRLSYHSVCTRHHRHLLDRCPSCAQPISPLRQVFPVLFDRCHHCNAFLAGTESGSRKVHQRSVQVQSHLDRMTREGWGKLGHQDVMSVIYFQILWIFYRLLAASQFAPALRLYCAQRLDLDGGTIKMPRYKEVERFNTEHRHILVWFAWELMTEWPRTFVEAAEYAGLSRRRLGARLGNIPFALQQAIDQYLSNSSPVLRKEEIEAGRKLLLDRHGQCSTSDLERLFGNNLSYRHRRFDRKCRPYGTGRYWKLDGVSPAVKTAARKAAMQAGESVGPWVDKIIRSALSLDMRD